MEGCAVSTGEKEIIPTHVWQSELAVSTEESTGKVGVSRALEQYVFNGLVRWTLNTRRAPVAGLPEEEVRCSAGPREEGGPTRADSVTSGDWGRTTPAPVATGEEVAAARGVAVMSSAAGESVDSAEGCPAAVGDALRRGDWVPAQSLHLDCSAHLLRRKGRRAV
ncbi:hypothetical protein MTO96_007608 [Rhipicephalus appendiculatus]